MKYPYINTAKNVLVAAVNSDVAYKNACIYQHTQNTCRFSIGGNGLQQLEFDYHIDGEMGNKQWFSFWVNSDKDGRWVKDAELDELENMNNVLAHNWAGEPH